MVSYFKKKKDDRRHVQEIKSRTNPGLSEQRTESVESEDAPSHEEEPHQPTETKKSQKKKILPSDFAS